jgi:hypothetical protein
MRNRLRRFAPGSDAGRNDLLCPVTPHHGAALHPVNAHRRQTAFFQQAGSDGDMVNADYLKTVKEQ